MATSLLNEGWSWMPAGQESGWRGSVVMLGAMGSTCCHMSPDSMSLQD